MKIDVVLPKIGMAMQDALIQSWLVKVGEYVQKDDPLVEIETEKVVETITSPIDGYIESINFGEGDIVEIEEVLLVISSTEPDGQTPETEQPEPEAVGPAVTPTLAETAGESHSVPFSRMRQTISKRMMESLHSTAQLTLMLDVDMTEIKKYREEVLAKEGITYTDLIVHAISKLLAEFPVFNAYLEGEALVQRDTINIGVAVALPDGLVVPVLSNVGGLSLLEISKQRRALVERVKQGQFDSSDLTGGSFTVSNLGTYGIDYFTPIINLPEVAILGVGKLNDKPTVVDGEIKIRSMMGLSLTIDHRVVDGAPGAEFLSRLAGLLSDVSSFTL